jgi:HSP20 family molecular chaperone IbpA
MLRPLVCSLVALSLSAGVALADDKKPEKPKTVSGSFASYKDGTLTIKVTTKKGEEPKAQDFKVADDVKVTTFTGADKTEAAAKSAFKNVKEGTPITVTLGDGDKVTAVQVGAPEKKGNAKADKARTVSGTFVSFKDGTLTIKVVTKKGEEPKAQEFKVADDAKVTTFKGQDAIESAPKSAFKDVKEGTPVTVTFGEGDKVAAVQVGSREKGEKKPEKPRTVSGTFASFKDGTLTIKVPGKKGDEPKAQEIKVADDAKVTLLDGDTKKELTAKDKDAFAGVKEGTAVTVTYGEGEKVAAVQIGSAKKKEKQ